MLFAQHNNSGHVESNAAVLGGEGAAQPTQGLDEVTYSTKIAAVAGAIAVLVADAATPTQGHVNTLNTAFAAFTPHVIGLRHYTAADLATVTANIATLVADAASPTQDHVNTLNTNWGTFTGGLI